MAPRATRSEGEAAIPDDWTRWGWLLALALLACIRIQTMAPDPWQWDEVLLTDAVSHGIDLRAHRPHPPGYPLLVEAATGLASVGASPYEALAVVGTAGGVLAVAALAALLFALGVSFNYACAGALFYAFVPSIWLFGVRGFSDAPAAACYLGASAAFVHGAFRRSPRSIAFGLLLFAAGLGLRPQGCIGLLPVALFSMVRSRREKGFVRWVLGGVLLAAMISIVVWFPAVNGSGGLAQFRAQLAIQAGDVRANVLLPLGELFSFPVLLRWLRDPFGSTPLSLVSFALAALGVATDPRSSGRIALVILPWMVTNVPVSSPFAAPRYAAVLMAGIAGLVALGLQAVSRRGSRAAAALTVGLVAACAAVGLRPVVAVASGPSPTVAAITAAATTPYAAGTLVTDEALRMHAERLAQTRVRSVIPGDRSVVASPGDTVILADRSIRGLEHERRFSFHEPLLSRISHGVLLDVQMGVAGSLLSVGRRAAAPGTAVVRYDDTLPASVDSPAPGQQIASVLEVKGWCRLRGGGDVAPLEFRIDGRPVALLRLERYPRPDVAAVIPEIGDPAEVGYAAVLESRAIEAGPHDLGVTFRAFDGRRRTYPLVRFRWVP